MWYNWEFNISKNYGCTNGFKAIPTFIKRAYWLIITLLPQSNSIKNENKMALE